MAIIRRTPWTYRPDGSQYVSIGQSNPLSNGLVRAFLCNEGHGGVIHEYVRGDHAIQDAGNPTAWVSDARGRTFDFRTSGASVDSFQFTDIVFGDSDPWSVAFGCNRINDGNSAHGTLIGDGVDLGSDYIWLEHDDSSVRLRVTATGGQNTDFTDTQILPEGYHDWVLTSDGGGAGAATARLYWDGIEFVSGTDRTLGIILANIGDGRGATGQSFRGRAFYIYIFDQQLTKTEAASLRNNPYQLFAPRTQIIPSGLLSGVVITDVDGDESWQDGDTGLVISGIGFV